MTCICNWRNYLDFNEISKIQFCVKNMFNLVFNYFNFVKWETEICKGSEDNDENYAFKNKLQFIK